MKVLLIDDDPEIVDVVVTLFMLRMPNASVVSACGGEQGLALLEIESPDVVILDLGLPDMDGFDVLRDIRRVSYVPIVILSVRHSQEDTVRALDLGADDYVLKPFSHMVLLARVQAVYYRSLRSSPRRRSPVERPMLPGVSATGWVPQAT